jgi:hypothetical protein
MAKNARIIGFIYFFACFWLFLAVMPVFGGGSPDTDLSKADELIEIREYDQASLILSDYARRHPDKFDAAQQRMRTIYQLREEFNQTADKLIWILENNPEDSEGILALTQKLYTLENENSPLLVNFVARIQEIAQFNLYRIRLTRILENGRERLDAGDCEGALRIYAGGMDIMRDQFFASGYGDRIENIARQETERLNTIIASFQSDSTQMGAYAVELARMINAGQIARVPEILNRLTPTMDRFIRQKQGLYTVLNTFERTLNEIRVITPDMLDRNHLAFLSVLIHGRTDESIQEGMLGAYDTYWKNSIGAVITAVSSYVENANSRSLASFNAKDYAGAANALAGIERYIELTPQFFNLHRELSAGGISSGGRASTTTLFGNNVLQADIPSYLNLRSLNEANNSLSQASVVARRRPETTTATTVALSAETQTRNTLAEIQRDLDAIKTRANQVDTEISRYQNIPHIKNAVSAIDSVNTSLYTDQTQSAIRYYTAAKTELDRNLAERRAEIQRGTNHLDGQTRSNENGVMTTYRYPSEALQELTAMLSAVTADIEHGNTLITQNRNEPAAVAANGQVMSLRTGIQNTLNELTALRTRGQTLADTARNRSSLAEAQRQEGDRLFREAQAAYQRRNYDNARELLLRASDRYTASLETQESPALRQFRDTQVVNLGQQIASAENEAIIAEVRNLVTSARVSYLEGNFQQAEDSLVRARNRWNITNTEENEEIILWLGMVRGAMSARSSRVIPATAPLYPEMSQLLSRAQRNYEEGVRLINAGQRSQGIAKFNEAREQTGQVKLMFPLNQEAGILELRMEQYTDQAAFNAAFEQRLRTAQAGVRQRSWQSFADLQNLAEINPRYPNIRSIMNQAEIDMGLRPPPPNPADIARSRELTASANRILENNTTTQFEAALVQINQAITLNPENAEATRVKDRLLTRMSMPGDIVLPSEDEETYQTALREYTAGNNLVAYALVERLLQNPRYRNITKIVDLQRRIQASL